MPAEKVRPSTGSTNSGSTGAEHGLKQERAVRTRRQILQAASEAFNAQGYPGVTIQDVATLAGVTKGAVYFHFANKEALAREVSDDFYRRQLELVASVTEEDLDPLDAVHELVLRTAQAFHDDLVIQAGARLQIEHSLIDLELPPPFVGFTEAVTGWFGAAEASGQLAPGVRPEVLGRVISSAVFGAQHISWRQHNRADVNVRVQEVLSVVMLAARARP